MGKKFGVNCNGEMCIGLYTVNTGSIYWTGPSSHRKGASHASSWYDLTANQQVKTFGYTIIPL